MHKFHQRLLSGLLCLAMVAGFAPTIVAADVTEIPAETEAALVETVEAVIVETEAATVETTEVVIGETEAATVETTEVVIGETEAATVETAEVVVEEQQSNPSFSIVASKTWDGITVLQPTVMETIEGIYYYVIHTAEELAYIAQTGGDWLTYNYLLANDIVLNDVELTYDSNGNLTVDAAKLNQWTPINGFSGIFDGNGFSISGVYVDTSSSAGFFEKCKGDILNLTVTNSYIKGGNQVGGICGHFAETGKDMTNCYFDGAVIGISSVGGLIGSNHTTYITNCGNYGDVWGTGDYVSGIVGSFYAYGIENCFNEGNIYSTGNYVAGITGYSDIYGISGCTNKGNITGNKYVAGICGYIENADIFNSGNNGTILGKDYVGGVCGYSIYGYVESWKSSIKDSYNIGAVTGDNYVGGITGYAHYADIVNSYTVGNVMGKTNAGAAIGHSDSVWGKGSVSNCYYFKDNVTNTDLTGFGNAPDTEGVVCNKKFCYFPVLLDPNADPACSNLGYIYDKENVDIQYLVSEATCTEQAVYKKSCVCGDAGTETFKYGSVLGHQWNDATCTAPKTCTVCKATEGKMLDHTYADKYDTTCDVCGYERQAEAQTISVYRLYNPYTQEHLLTGGADERDVLISVGWSLDGVAWEAPEEGIPVYRLYNPYDDWHTYTTSESERDTMVTAGWTVDGVVSFGYTGKDGKPIYRLFNPYVQTNYHLFTAGVDERDQLVSVGWILEGVAWSAVK